VTEVTSLNPTTSLLDTGTAASVVADSAQEVNDRFLKLLVAQMNNQDPLNPLDNAQVTSQMAQINTVSGINNLNETVRSLLASYARLEALQAAQLTGRTVLVTGNGLVPAPDADGNAAATGAVQLAQPADQVTVEIRDANGLLVRSLDLGQLGEGIRRFDWDGRTDAGAPVAAGKYSFTIKATAAGKEIGAAPLAAARVEGVRQDAGGTQLILAGLGPVAYTDIQQIL
jgi:flagellar basal-body rod modification protein FlgD